MGVTDQDSVKNCEGSEILALLHASRLAYHSWMDVGKRHQTSGSEQKDSLLLTAVARVSAFGVVVPLTQTPTGQHEELQITTAHSVGYNTGEDLSA